MNQQAQRAGGKLHLGAPVRTCCTLQTDGSDRGCAWGGQTKQIDLPHFRLRRAIEGAGSGGESGF